MSFDSQNNARARQAHVTKTSPAPIQTGNASADGPTVLIVEDDPDISMALRDLLEFEGLHVDCAETCRQAFSAIEQHMYNIILLDLGLPDGDGTLILEKLHETHPALPVIVLTATNPDLGPLRPYAHLTKPWQRIELCQLVHHAINIPSDSNKN